MDQSLHLQYEHLNSETQRKLLSTTISHSEAVNRALIDGERFYKDKKLTSMTKSMFNGTNLKV